MALEDTAPTRAEIKQALKSAVIPAQARNRLQRNGARKAAVRSMLQNRNQKLNDATIERILTDLPSYAEWEQESTVSREV